MVSINEVTNLRNHLRKVLKTEESNISDIEFVDFNKNQEKLFGPQRVIIWGRKGTGKTILLKQAEKHQEKKNILPLYIDCKDYRNHSYPDLLIKILISLFKSLNECERKGYHKIINRISFSRDIKQLKELLKKPDEVKKDLTMEDGNSSEVEEGIGLNNLGFSERSNSFNKKQQKYSITESKIYHLEKELENYKIKLISLIKVTKYKEIYVLLDEFYYINLRDQPLMTDYLYRLFFHTPYWIKLATNRYRTQLEERTVDGSSYGMTDGEEFTSIDLDFTLEKFSSAEEFLTVMLDGISKKIEIKNISNWFAGDSFRRLVWASGGVPRDFINLLIGVLDKINEENQKINISLINDASQKYFDEKLSSFNTEYDRENKIKELWEDISRFCIDLKRTTAFLVEVKPDAIDNKKNFRDLIDTRLIHPAAKNITSKIYSGRRFNAYILNMGSYAKQLGLRKNPLTEINILQTYEKTGDSPFRFGTPILSNEDLEKINDLLREQEEKELTKIKKERKIINSSKKAIQNTLEKFL